MLREAPFRLGLAPSCSPTTSTTATTMSPAISHLIVSLQNPLSEFPSLENIGSRGHQALWVTFASESVARGRWSGS